MARDSSPPLPFVRSPQFHSPLFNGIVPDASVQVAQHSWEMLNPFCHWRNTRTNTYEQFTWHARDGANRMHHLPS